MNSTRSSRASARVRRRRRRLVALTGVVLLVGGIVAGVTVWLTGQSEPLSSAPAPTSTGSAAPTPVAVELTASQQLLADSTDPSACAVSFTGDAIADAPQLQSEGALYAGLPVPQLDGFVFAGWYRSAGDAAALSIEGRVNGSEIVACTDREITLHGAWVTPEQNVAENARIPILMYHQFTTNPDGESGWLRGNFAYIGDFEQQISYIASSGFYLPTWDELSAFIDGRLFLPAHSVIVTDDDAHQTWLELAAPIVERYQVLATSFVITVWRSDPSPNPYVLQRSHTHGMHEAGANGDGLMTNLSATEIAADMQTSADILGVKEVMAYPFGHFNDTAKEGLRQAGFEMARTIEPGYVTIGTDKLALPTIRIDYGMGLDALIGRIG